MWQRRCDEAVGVHRQRTHVDAGSRQHPPQGGKARVLDADAAGAGGGQSNASPSRPPAVIATRRADAPRLASGGGGRRSRRAGAASPARACRRPRGRPRRGARRPPRRTHHPDCIGCPDASRSAAAGPPASRPRRGWRGRLRMHSCSRGFTVVDRPAAPSNHPSASSWSYAVTTLPLEMPRWDASARVLGRTSPGRRTPCASSVRSWETSWSGSGASASRWTASGRVTSRCVRMTFLGSSPSLSTDSAPFQTGPTPTVHFRTCNRTSITPN